MTARPETAAPPPCPAPDDAPKRPPPAASFRAVGRAARMIHAAAPGWTWACLALVAIGAAVPVASAVALKLLTDAAVAAGRAGGGLDAVLAAAALTAALALIGHVAEAAELYARDVHAAHVDVRFQSLVQERSAAIDLARWEEPAFHDALHLAQQEVTVRPRNIATDLLSLIQNTLTLAGMAALLAGLHWSLPVVVVAVSIPEFLVRFRAADRMHRFHAAQVERERRARLFGEFLTRPAFAREIRLYGLAERFADAFREVRAAVLADRRRVLAWRAWATVATKVPPTLALFAGMVLLAGRVADGSTSVGDMVMFLAAFQQGQGNLRALLRDLAALHEDGLFLAHLLGLLALRPAIVDPPNPVPVPTDRPLGLRFEAVSFTYPGRPVRVLDRLDMDVPPGAFVALVGRNGAGKSTLIKLMTRLYEPDEGRVLLDGRPLAAFALADLRAAFAVTAQDFAQYPLTLAENVALGAVGRAPDPAALRAALDAAAAEGLEPRLPAGLDTTLARAMRGGADLSLGEWQKVAIARARFRDAPIAVYDEPTSALDARAEDEVLARIVADRGRRTLLLVTHRLSAVRGADLIHVLDHGRIVESGDHAALTRAGGIYADLFEIQARAYADAP